MKHTEILQFFPPAELQEMVRGIFEYEKSNIQICFPDADIQNVGSTAIPGAWGKYDIDIQIRVTQEDFDDILGWMNIYAEEKNTDCWTKQYATYKDRNDAIDYNVTVIGSRQDIFHHIRDYFIETPEALQQYMDLKMQHQGKTYGEYREVRYAFFKEVRAIVRRLKNLPE